jgi:hypothetical protein
MKLVPSSEVQATSLRKECKRQYDGTANSFIHLQMFEDAMPTTYVIGL